jgi:glycosyltransferase involved in cell wall biosynthesis
MKIYYSGAKGEGWGWGVFGESIARELAKLGMLTENAADADVALIPLADHDLNAGSPVRAKVNLAVCFFEFELGPNAAANAAKYDVVFAGSTWCLDRLAERGIHNTALLIQGVDGDVFSPQPKRQPDGQFRIFSGGKFEYRKGQDLVIAAFREFAKTHPEAHLVCSWFNPWPDLAKQLVNKMGWDGPTVNQSALYHAVLCAEGLRPEQFTILPQLSHTDLAREMANTDAGLFPNRCEGGTNLVLMEYAALGRPVIANTRTGHADVIEAISYGIRATENPSTRWAEQRVEDIVERMEMAHYRNLPVPVIPRWPWRTAAEKIVTTARKYFARLK